MAITSAEYIDIAAATIVKQEHRIAELEAANQRLGLTYSRLLLKSDCDSDSDRKRIAELEAENKQLEAVAEWFIGIGLDYIPNDVYHDRGGFKKVAALEGK